MLKVSIIGGTGYAGQELIRLLLGHPEVEIVTVGSRSFTGMKFSEIYRNFDQLTEAICEVGEINVLAEKSDVIFLALPHGIASKMINKEILEKTKIIDLGADYRLKDKKEYETWYQTEHFSTDLIEEAVYGLCELHREEIRQGRLIANPGCYTTCSILSLAPLIKNNLIDEHSIIIDAKSGVTGAGRGSSLELMYCECNETIKAYKIGEHRHTPEIEQELGLLNGKEFHLLFTPHLVPMNRGILAVSYGKLKTEVKENELRELYIDFYGNEFFVRLTGDKMPETRWVKGSNFCDIGIKVDERTKRVVVVGAIDNLIKGAAGQAVQNMNIMFNLEEKLGIDLIGDFPV
ncbi:MAG: N-acetyl-gamma-glutamyl-phosphate reductase [Eubacteriaceae bacterium]